MSNKLEKNLILQKNPWLSDVKIVAKSESTQKDAKADGQVNCLYLAEQQTATYGRFGRQYFAAENGGIYMSLLLKPADHSVSSPQYTVLMAAAIISAIKKLTDKKPLIKWVNDLYLNDKKFVGILAEASINPEQQTQIVLGVGINFSISEFPDDIRDKATSLFLNEDPTISRSELIAEIWAEFNRLSGINYFEIYKAHSFVLGKQVEFVQEKKLHSGLAVDLTASGELVVERADGQKQTLSSGEISLKKWT